MEQGMLTDQDYRYIYSQVPRICVDLLIKVGPEFILKRRKITPHNGSNENTWHMPGGRILMRETTKEAIERIAKNEVGVKVTVEKLLGYIDFPNDGEFVHSVSLVFLVNLKSGQIDQSNGEIKLFTKLPSNMMPGHGRFLKEHKQEL